MKRNVGGSEIGGSPPLRICRCLFLQKRELAQYGGVVRFENSEPGRKGERKKAWVKKLDRTDGF